MTPILAGFLVDRLGLHYIMVTMPLFAIVASAVAFAVNEDSNVVLLVFNYIFYAIGGQSIHLCTYMAAVHWFSRQRSLLAIPLALCLMFFAVPFAFRIVSLIEELMGLESG